MIVHLLNRTVPLSLMEITVRERDVLDLIPPGIRPWLLRGGVALIVLIVVWAVWRRLARVIRRRRPPRIHPKLAKYNIDHAQLDRQRRELAAGIVATSTGARLAGFRIVRQVDAVFVEGHRTPEEALIALKAAAAERGANALLNVQTERTAAGKCAASGDAIVAAPFAAKPPPRPASPGPPASD